jgi:hypothetical protein
MSTNPPTTPTPEPHPTTEIAARGRPDPWTAADEAGGSPPRPSTRTQRQFEPTASDRLRNLVDGENAYCE